MPQKVIFFILSFLTVSLIASNIRIDTSTRNFIDQNNRALLFHGVNVVFKLPPYHPPNLETFDPLLSLCAQDWENLRSWGFNFIRLYISWEGTETQPGVYNTTYVEQVLSIVRTAAQYNITVLLDAHQDAMSRKFCGEGFPHWALNRSNFPAPYNITIDYNSEGLANLTQCEAKEFGHYYFTEAVQAAWWAFYNNYEGLQDHFANFWAYIAGVFKNEPNVIAYEIINEPFSSDIYHDPFNIIDSQVDDIRWLQPLYKRINDAIRPVDNNTILFFEPIVDDLYKVNLEQGPGGPGYNDKQALSYHVYCLDVDNQGEANNKLVCHQMDDTFFNTKWGASVKIGVPGFMTEFGGVGNITGALDEANYVADLADAHLQSWSYWQFKGYNDITTGATPFWIEGFYDPEGNLATQKVKMLSRNYAYATCGVPTAMKFDMNTGDFTYKYQPGNCNGESTELFISEQFYYQNGFNAEFTGCKGCSLASLGQTGYYKVVISGTPDKEIGIAIKAKTNIQINK